jgi:molybdopterin/thiamine biosynthesis adenylyltransferase
MTPTRPALRDSVLVLEGDGDELHFLLTGSAVQKTFSVDPPTRRLLRLIDGSRTVAELEAAVPDGAVRDVLGVLADEDLLAAPAATTPVDERYGRQLGLLEELAREDGVTVAGAELQARLRAASVAVIGTGGLGSWVLLSLAAAGIGRLVVMDSDTVELSNLNRQILFSAADAGRAKTAVAAERLAAHGARVETIEGLLAGPGDVPHADVVINCADRPSVAETSDWVAEACVARGIPHIVGGAYAYHTGALGLTVVPGETPCWQCARDAVGRHAGGAVRGRSGPGPSFAPFSAVTANVVAYDAVRVLLGLPPVTAGRLGEIDFRTLALRWRELPRQCPHARTAA